MTDTKTLHRDTSADPPPERKKLLDMSATQLVGGALAAMTSAVIGARLGVAGTVIGAAIGSLVAGIAGSLYTASIRHTRSKISSVLVGKVGDTTVEVTTVSDDTLVSDRTLISDQTGRHWDTETEPAAVAPASGDPVAADVVVDDQGRIQIYPALKSLSSTPVAVIQSTNDSYVASAEARQLLGPDTPTLRLYEVESSNHRFGGGREKVLEDVDDALHWIEDSRRVAAR